MLQSIHNATKNWVGYVILFIMTIFLVGAFALWGVGDIFRGGNDTTVAEVGGKTISAAEFDREFRGQLRRLSGGENGEMTVEQARALGIDRAVLDTMIERVAVDERVHDLGLVGTDSAVRAQIEGDQTFQGTDGRFDRGKFSRLLQGAQIGESEYAENMRADIARNQYVLSAVAGLAAPPRMARLLYDYVYEQRVVEHMVLTPDGVPSPPEPTDAQLAAYHKAHTPQFSTPEYRELEFVQIGVNEVASDIAINEADIKKAWEDRKDDFQKPEQRELEQIAFPTQAAAQAAYAKIQQGAPFLTVAHDAGKTDADIKLGTFTKANLDARLAAPAFALAEGATSAPVQGPFAWVILRVTKITPGETKTYEQVHDELRAQLVKEHAAERIADVSNKFEDARAGDKAFAEAATAAGLTAHRVTIDNKGLAPDGSKPAIPAAPEFLQQAFATESGNESDMFEGADHTQYAVRVNTVRAPQLKPLASVRAQVRDGWMAEQRAKLLLDRAKALSAQMEREHAIAGAASAIGKTPATSAPLTRGSAGEVFSQDAITKLFAAPPGTAIYARVGRGDGYVLARVVKVNHPAPTPQQLEQMRATLSQQVGQDLQMTLQKGARAEAGVEIHQKTLAQLLGETQ